jgi:thiol-disulfide isomerase/thioredoxin
MSTARSISKKPTLLTALLSVAAVAGYLAYRFTAGTPEVPAESMASTEEAHMHELAPMLADSLPDIVLEDFAGTPTSLASYAGRPLLINFWATWCGPCLREIPLLKTFHDEQPGIDVVGIAVDRIEPVLEFAEEMQFNYPSLIGQSSAYDAMAVFHNDAQVMPFSVYTTAEGAVLATHSGELHPEHLAHFVETVEQLADGSIDLAQARERMAPRP